jgi:predicted TIM-barrel fold metal-dependent hydrolase
MVPILERRPSEYLQEQFWVSTQPIEEPDDSADLVDTIRLVGEDRIVYASDCPHHDFDHPKAILRLPMPAETKRKIIGENALRVFSRIAAPVAAEA